MSRRNIRPANYKTMREFKFLKLSRTPRPTLAKPQSLQMRGSLRSKGSAPQPGPARSEQLRRHQPPRKHFGAKRRNGWAERVIDLGFRVCFGPPLSPGIVTV